ncbi:MAG: cell division protein ZipA C-terminal FtsZ-binding domain-containing protein [Burkholderiales bacterium]
MSELQIWLAAGGLLFIIGVFVFNKTQEAKVRRRTDQAFGQQPVDVLLGESAVAKMPSAAPPDARSEDQDPVLSASVAHESAPQASAASDRIEHQLGLPQPVDLPKGAGPLHDPRVDALVVLVLAESQPGETILRHAEALLGVIDKPVHWEGLDESKRGWMRLSPKASYQAIRAGIQLVDRSGRVAEADLNLAFARLQELSATLAGEVHLPSRSEALRLAERLDTFCSEVDVQIGLNIVKPDGGTFAGTRIRQVVEASGCALGRDGRFRRLAPNGGEYYTVANLEPNLFLKESLETLKTHAITAVMDVPCVPATGSSFEAFRAFAFHLAQVLGGQVVDDNRQPIQASALEAIGQEVENIRARMRDEGIEPGGPIALRVFAQGIAK